MHVKEGDWVKPRNADKVGLVTKVLSVGRHSRAHVAFPEQTAGQDARWKPHTQYWDAAELAVLSGGQLQTARSESAARRGS